MALAAIIIEDMPDGTVQISGDFGDAVEETSQAHQMIMVLLKSVLANAKTYQVVEDTAPDANVEPSRIITPDSNN